MMWNETLEKNPRVLVEAKLTPLQGDRFQPTGFADLGPSTYTLSDGTDMLLVESPQSVANRMESVCWDFGSESIVSHLNGLPYVQAMEDGQPITNSMLEAHRLNSGYIIEGSDNKVLKLIQDELQLSRGKPVNIASLARVVFKYDPGSVLHGVFLSRKELAGGRLRLQRLLSGFVEARGVRPVESGGVKLDRLNPEGDAKKGYGNVPFARTEFIAEDIRAYFNFDLATLRAYRLGKQAEELLLTLGMWKIQEFLASGLRLRTACDLESGQPVVTQPQGMVLPAVDVLQEELPRLIKSCESLFADPPVTVVDAPKVPVKKRDDAA